MEVQPSSDAEMIDTSFKPAEEEKKNKVENDPYKGISNELLDLLYFRWLEKNMHRFEDNDLAL